MTKEEMAIRLLTQVNEILVNSNSWLENTHEPLNMAFDMAIKAIKQESESKQFAKWVAEEIFDENWEYNKDAFAELACRKLAKLGIVRAKGDVWELVEPQESEDKK